LWRSSGFSRILARAGWVGPTGPAFGRPDDKPRDNHQLQFATLMNFALQ
jgi:hypothetical protein